MNQEQDTNQQHVESMHDQASTIQTKIDSLKSKAESSGDAGKQGYQNEIQKLSQEKQNIMDKIKNYESNFKGMADKAKGFFKDAGN
jgi:uncharacterized coiled-coil DUF342 family protein